MDGNRVNQIPPRLERAACAICPVAGESPRRVLNSGAPWHSASRLAASYGVSRAATLLGLDYYCAAETNSIAVVARTAGAIGHGLAGVYRTVGVDASIRWRICPGVRTRAGSKLRVHCQGGAIPDQALLGRRRRGGGARSTDAGEYPRLQVMWADGKVSQSCLGVVEVADRRRRKASCSVARTLACGTHVRLARPLAPEQGLRATDRLQRKHGTPRERGSCCEDSRRPTPIRQSNTDLREQTISG